MKVKTSVNSSRSHRYTRPKEKMASNANSAIYRVSLPIESKYFGLIIGAKGATLKEIKTETKATITLPRPNQTGDVVITGESQESVDAARERIEIIVALRHYLTTVNHLISVRIVDETIKSNFELFKQEVLADSSVDGLNEAMFMRSDTLHMTIDAMTLLNENDFAVAKQALNECVEKVIIPVKNEFGKIEMNISGVSVANHANPRQASVVFGKIESASLQKIADGILEHFLARGISKCERNYTGVKMEMVMISTRKAQCEAEANGSLQPMPLKYLDVRPILAKYAEHGFGTQEINEIVISLIEENSDDCYKTVASVTF